MFNPIFNSGDLDLGGVDQIPVKRGGPADVGRRHRILVADILQGYTELSDDGEGIEKKVHGEFAAEAGFDRNLVSEGTFDLLRWTKEWAGKVL